MSLQSFATKPAAESDESSGAKSGPKLNPEAEKNFEEQQGERGTLPDTLPEDCDQDLTLFHKPSQHTINIRGSHRQGITLHFRNANMVNLMLKEKYPTKAEDEKPDEPSMKSIEDHRWKPVELKWKNLPDYYLKLSKIRLTGLVVITQQAGYAMAPGAFDPLTFLWCSVGTALTSAAANAINQVYSINIANFMQNIS